MVCGRLCLWGDQLLPVLLFFSFFAFFRFFFHTVSTPRARPCQLARGILLSRVTNFILPVDLALHSGMSRTRRSKIPEAAASIQIQDTNNDPVLLDLWQLRVVEGETVPRGDDVVQEVEPDSAISQLIAAASHLDVGGHREDLHEDIEQGHGGGVEEEEEEDDDDDDEGNSDASDDEEHRELRLGLVYAVDNRVELQQKLL